MGYFNEANDPVPTFIGFNFGQSNAYNVSNAASKLEGANTGSIWQSIMELPALFGTSTSAHSIHRWNNPTTWSGYQGADNKEVP